jgi:hypothetical protein
MPLKFFRADIYYMHGIVEWIMMLQSEIVQSKMLNINGVNSTFFFINLNFQKRTRIISLKLLLNSNVPRAKNCINITPFFQTTKYLNYPFTFQKRRKMPFKHFY